MNRGLLHVIVLLLGLLAWAVPCRATTEGEWLTVGIGRGNDDSRESNELLDEAAFLLSGSILRDSHIWSLRYARVGFEQSSGDLAFLYERVLSRRRVLVSVGAGVGLLYRDLGGTSFEPTCCAYESVPESEFFDKVGIAWAAQVMTGTRAAVGWGLQGFGSVAGERSFWGVALVVQIGGREAGQACGE